MTKENEANMENQSLYAVLYANLPEHRGKSKGKIDARKISEDLGISYQAFYKWFKADGQEKVPTGRVKQLIGLPGSTLTLEKLLPYTDVI